MTTAAEFARDSAEFITLSCAATLLLALGLLLSLISLTQAVWRNRSGGNQ